MKLYLPEMNSVPTIAITFLKEVKTKIDTIHLFGTINLALMPFPDSPIVDTKRETLERHKSCERWIVSYRHIVQWYRRNASHAAMMLPIIIVYDQWRENNFAETPANMTMFVTRFLIVASPIRTDEMWRSIYSRLLKVVKWLRNIEIAFREINFLYVGNSLTRENEKK